VTIKINKRAAGGAGGKVNNGMGIYQFCNNSTGSNCIPKFSLRRDKNEKCEI
jgi:hypothetical protein